MACQARKEINDVALTDFTKELISLYINDIENLSAKNRQDEIIIISVTDTSYYYLSVFANNSKEYKYCKDDFIGQTVYLGHLIRVFGNENSIFYSLNEENRTQKPCKDNVTEYDPSVWRICFHKDESFCKMKTYKVNVYEDISAIEDLVGKYFNVSETMHKKSDIYQSHEVENSPKFILGEDSLRHLISSNFKIKKNNIQSMIPIVVNIVVDTNGKASLNEIIKSSNDIELDNEAVRVVEKICQYEFAPALHRGQKVDVIYPIMFLRNDIIP
jgi:TonB family protein